MSPAIEYPDWAGGGLAGPGHFMGGAACRGQQQGRVDMTNKTPWPTTADGKWLVLRTVDADWRSRDGFRWRRTVETVAPDWDPDPDRDCGGGLHGLLWGCGDAGLLSSDPDALWLVVAVDPTDVANPDQVDKVRFRAGLVCHHGTRDEAVDYLMAHGAVGLPVAYGTATAGNYGTATAGNCGTATAGNWGTATAGYRGTATAGYRGTATAGNDGTATAGDRGTATAGYCGTATAGDWGTAIAGYGGTATAGYWGTLIITWYDGARSRRAVGYIGEGGIKPDTPYRVNGQGEFYADDMAALADTLERASRLARSVAADQQYEQGEAEK